MSKSRNGYLKARDFNEFQRGCRAEQKEDNKEIHNKINKVAEDLSKLVGYFRLDGNLTRRVGERVRCLVVDDMQAAAMQVSDMVESELDWQARVCFTYKAAEKIIERDPFDVLIVDYILSDANNNGIDLCRRAKSINSAICTVLISGYPVEDLCQNAECVDLFLKKGDPIQAQIAKLKNI